MSSKTDTILAWLLLLYLLAVGIGTSILLITHFPELKNTTKATTALIVGGKPLLQLKPGQMLLALAFMAGVTGSFLHTAQSLSTYMGNRSFRASWAAWYFLRPWVGGVLGLTIFLGVAGGLLINIDKADIYGVIALGLLGGWFSKVTTDKLKEVFETLFQSNEDKNRNNKVNEIAKPQIEEILPREIQPSTQTLVIKGRNFNQESVFCLEEEVLKTEFITDGELRVSLSSLAERPHGKTVAVYVKNGEKGAESNHSQVIFLQLDKPKPE